MTWIYQQLIFQYRFNPETKEVETIKKFITDIKGADTKKKQKQKTQLTSTQGEVVYTT